MYCPVCQEHNTRVLDSRVVEQGAAIRRRRECPACNYRFTTVEKAQLLVVKRNGVSEPFSREKVITGVRRACQGRDVSDDALKRLAQEVEQTVRHSQRSQVPAREVGLAILEPLKALDEVAYLRFASVYKQFDSAEDFQKEIRQMKSQARAAARATGTRR